MKLECKIKKALKIESPSGGYKYCNLKMNPRNKKKCKKCQHFKWSEYTSYEVADSVVRGIDTAIKAINNLGDAFKSINRGDEENGRKEN